jgi:hypothetical protein
MTDHPAPVLKLESPRDCVEETRFVVELLRQVTDQVWWRQLPSLGETDHLAPVLEVESPRGWAA